MYKRNALLELWRFFFCIAVLGFHIFTKANMNYFHAGYLGVEFFFVVSGYFVGSYYIKYQAAKPIKERLTAVAKYGLSRLKRLYPLYILALVIMLFIKTYMGGNGIKGMLTLVKNCFAEFFLLQWTPLGNEVLISPGWFVPSVFFGGILFVAILAVTGKMGGYFVAPLISFLLYRYYFLLIGKIDVIYAHHSVLRGIAGIGFGVFVYFICRNLGSFIQSFKISETGKKYIMIASNIIASMVFLSLFVYTNFGRRSEWDFLVIALFGVGLLLLMVGAFRLPDKLTKTMLFLGKITYPIYVLQMPVIELFFYLRG